MTTKTITNSTTATYFYSGNGVTLVNAGVQGAPGQSGVNYGIFISGNNDTLFNQGTIYGQRVGVYITGSGDSVVNDAGKTIIATEPDRAGVTQQSASKETHGDEPISWSLHLFLPWVGQIVAC
jgi:hypothetical protein